MFKTTIKEQVGAIIFGVMTAIIGALILSFLAGVFKFNQGVLRPVNQVLKTIAILLSCLLFLRGEKGFLKGAITGLFVALITALIASFFGNNFWNGLVIDLLIFALVGAISGVIAVNIKTK